MLKKILSFFSNKEPEEAKVRFSDIEEISSRHFDDYIEKIMIPSFNTLKREIKEQCRSIEEGCKELEDAKLKNEKIPIREKQIMEGNRNSYIKHARILLQQMNVPGTYKDIHEADASFNEVLDHFTRHTIKPIQIMNHFFEHETNAIHKKIGELKKQYENLKMLVDDEKYQAHLNIKKGIDKSENTKKGKSLLEEDMKNNEKLVKDTSKEVIGLKKDVENRKASEEHRRYNESKEKRKEIDQKLHSIRTNAKAVFSRLERALKKYERIAMDDTALVHAYLSDAYNAISGDAEHKGNKILETLSERINNGSIELKNKEKVLDEIKKMLNNDYIEKTNDKIVRLNNELADVKEVLNRLTVNDEINELQEKVAISNKKIEDHNAILEEMKNKLESYSEEKIIKELEENLSKVMEKKVKIVKE